MSEVYFKHFSISEYFEYLVKYKGKYFVTVRLIILQCK